MPKKTIDQPEQEVKTEVTYIGIDTHVGKNVVVRKEDGLTPQPAQSFRLEKKFIEWVMKQKAKAHRVICCYEAGPTGYTLYRKLLAEGVECHVIAPQKWAENSESVKTDKRDARLLCERLFSYENGNKKAFKVIRVPSVEQEQARAMSRLRESLKKDHKRMAQRGRMMSLYHGITVKGAWWKPRKWAELCEEYPFLEALLTPIKNSLIVLEKELKELTQKLEEEAVGREKLPKGLGALTWRVILGEFHDFNRFNNRREVSNYTGLCPREWSTGGRRLQGGIHKHGNRLLRQYLVEAVWRLIRWQPNWHVLVKKREELAQANGGRKKQLVTAMARQLSIDIWRLYTDQTSMERLGLVPN